MKPGVDECVSHFIFLAWAYDGLWPVPSLAVSPSNQQCAVGVGLLVMVWVAGEAEISDQISAQTDTLIPYLSLIAPPIIITQSYR